MRRRATSGDVGGQDNRSHSGISLSTSTNVKVIPGHLGMSPRVEQLRGCRRDGQNGKLAAPVCCRTLWRQGMPANFPERTEGGGSTTVETVLRNALSIRQRHEDLEDCSKPERCSSACTELDGSACFVFEGIQERGGAFF